MVILDLPHRERMMSSLLMSYSKVNFFITGLLPTAFSGDTGS